MSPKSGVQVKRTIEDSQETLDVAVTRAVATAEDTKPTALPPIESVLPTDALKQIHTGSTTDVTVSFEYAGHPISVDGRAVCVYATDVSSDVLVR